VGDEDWSVDGKEIFTIAVQSLRYPFCDEIREFFIDELLNIFELREQDSIFEAYKSVISMGHYPLLFMEARRDTYNRAWKVYGERLWEDVAEQTFIVCTSMAIGLVVKAIMYSNPFTSGFAKVTSAIAYFTSYAILTKYFMDEKMHQSQTMQRSKIFYSAGSRMTIPLNDKAICDRLLRDSSLAGLLGHPGAYYAKVYGGATGHQYTADVIASPPNSARTNTAGLGLALYLASFGMNPYAYYGLDFEISSR
jgi:hypothetical protein